MATSSHQKVIIYSKSSCPYCMGAKAFFDRKNIPYTEIDVEADPRALEQMLKDSGGRRTVPQIFIDGTHIGGFDDLVALDRNKGLTSQ